MKDHPFVEEVASKMIEYNHSEYLIDMDEIISNNKYGNIISNLLIEIKKILSNEIKISKNNLKRFIYQIIIFENGRDCCLELICKKN